MTGKQSLACALAAWGALFLGALSAHAQSPAFRVDPYWPKPLPNNWVIGQVGGMAVDAQDNIWVFQRPRSLTEDEKGAALDPSDPGLQSGRRCGESLGRSRRQSRLRLAAAGTRDFSR